MPGSRAGVARVWQVKAPSPPIRCEDRAELIAQSITDESFKASALADVAKNMAATDPYRAERIAQSISDKFWQAIALVKIAEA
jgi:hypothetical protein